MLLHAVWVFLRILLYQHSHYRLVLWEVIESSDEAILAIQESTVVHALGESRAVVVPLQFSYRESGNSTWSIRWEA